MKTAMCREINLTGAELLGKDRDTLTGYPLVDYVVEDDRAVFYEHVRQCVTERHDTTRRAAN